MIIELFKDKIVINDGEDYNVIELDPYYRKYDFNGTFLTGIDIDDNTGKNVLSIRSNNLCIIDKRNEE